MVAVGAAGELSAARIQALKCAQPHSVSTSRDSCSTRLLRPKGFPLWCKNQKFRTGVTRCLFARAHLYPIEFLFDLTIGIVADAARIAQRVDCTACMRDHPAPQYRIARSMRIASS